MTKKVKRQPVPKTPKGVVYISTEIEVTNTGASS